MSRTLLISFSILTLAVSAEAQPSSAQATAGKQLSPPQWDVAGSIGLLSSDPVPSDAPYSDDWYHEARFAASVGRYWTRHLKTELEFATSTEGSRFSNRTSVVPGAPPYYPLSVYENFRLNQVSGRVVWQFLDNTWVHPYVFGGVTLDAQRQMTFIPEQFFYPDPRTPSNRIQVTPEIQQEDTSYRFGPIAGAGAKMYVTRTAFFNAAVVTSYSNPTRTVSFIGGFGVDF